MEKNKKVEKILSPNVTEAINEIASSPNFEQIFSHPEGWNELRPLKQLILRELCSTKQLIRNVLDDITDEKAVELLKILSVNDSDSLEDILSREADLFLKSKESSPDLKKREMETSQNNGFEFIHTENLERNKAVPLINSAEFSSDSTSSSSMVEKRRRRKKENHSSPKSLASNSSKSSTQQQEQQHICVIDEVTIREIANELTEKLIVNGFLQKPSTSRRSSTKSNESTTSSKLSSKQEVVMGTRNEPIGAEKEPVNLPQSNKQAQTEAFQTVFRTTTPVVVSIKEKTFRNTAIQSALSTSKSLENESNTEIEAEPRKSSSEISDSSSKTFDTSWSIGEIPRHFLSPRVVELSNSNNEESEEEEFLNPIETVSAANGNVDQAISSRDEISTLDGITDLSNE